MLIYKSLMIVTIMKTASIAIILAMLSTGAADVPSTALSDSLADLIAAPIPALPAIRSTLSDAEYAKRKAKALAGSVATAVTPYRGNIICEIVAGSQAEQLGLTVGDVIVAIDDHVVGSAEQFTSLRDKSAAQSLDVWSTTTLAHRSVRVGSGTIGIFSRDYWNLEAEYLQSLDLYQQAATPPRQGSVDRLRPFDRCPTINSI